MTPAEVIALFAEPKKLLRRCYLHIAGGATRSPTLPDAPLPPTNGQAEIKTFKVEIGHQTVRGFTTGMSGLFGTKKDRVFAKITKLSGVAKTVLGTDEFNAYYVPMVQTSDVTSGNSHYTLPTGIGALEIMITSKLSGCTFGVGSDGNGAILVSHVQPDSSITDQTNRYQNLNNTISGGFNNLTGHFRIDHEYSTYGAVIGKRTGTEWKFYLQASTLGQTTGKHKSNYSISKVEVIE